MKEYFVESSYWSVSNAWRCELEIVFRRIHGSLKMWILRAILALAAVGCLVPATRSETIG